MAAVRATKFLLDTLPPIAKGEQRRMQLPVGTVSFSNNSPSLTHALESFGDSCGVSGKINAVNVTRSRQVYREFFLDATGVRRKKQNAIAQTCRFANVVRDEHDGFATGFPNLLDVAVKLLACQRI